LARELANKDRYCPSRCVPEPRLVLRGEGMVRTIYPRERREFVPRGEPPHKNLVGVLGLGVVICWTFIRSWPIRVWQERSQL
jgi:hypothetical protein